MRRQVIERAVRAALIMAEPPGFNDVLGLGERGELEHVQARVSQSSVKSRFTPMFDSTECRYEAARPQRHISCSSTRI